MKYCPFCAVLSFCPAPFLFARSVGKPCLGVALVIGGCVAALFLL